jgi:HD superfamily phosphodiesterase
MAKSNLPNLRQVKNKMIAEAKQHHLLKQVGNTWTHSTVVWKYARRIAALAKENGFSININLLKIGCYTHDIGRMITGSKGSQEALPPIYHFYEGYRIMNQWGYPQLARICLCHACGGGLDRATNKKFGFLNRNIFPVSIEEKIIAYADARTDFNKGTGPTIWPIEKAYNRYKIYKGSGSRLLRNHKFILKITDNKIT